MPRSLLLWLAGCVGFATMAGFAAAYDYFPADLWVSHRLQEIDSPVFEAALDLPEALSEWPFALAVWLPGLVAFGLLERHWRVLIPLAAPLGALANTAIKELIARPRPTPDLIWVADAPSTFSFPSGHAITAVLLFGSFLYLATSLVRQPPLRLLIQLATLYGIVFTGLARIYHGVHWLSDVYGAAFLGTLVLSVIIAAHRKLLRP